MKKFFFTGVFIFLLLAVTKAQDIRSVIEKPVFQSITNSDGLSQGSIQAIVQDYLGFIWIGTGDGLNRYDGYNIKVYRSRPENEGTISSNLINDLETDQQGRIWVATANGLNLYIPGIDQFENIDLPFVGKDRIVNEIAFDRFGCLWIGTQSSGVLRLDTASRDVQLFVHIAGDQSTVSSNTIRSILPDTKGNVWIATQDRGLDMIPYQSKAVKKFRYEEGNPHSMSDYLIMDMKEDDEGNLWLGSYGNSLIYLDTETMKFKKYHKRYPFSQTRLHSILSLNLQHGRYLWIGSDSEGLFCYDTESGDLKHYSEGNTENTILYNTISSLFPDQSNNLWIGTLGKGINILSPFTKEFFSITNEDRGGLKLDFSSLREIYEDSDSVAWVCGYGGVQRIDLAKHESRLVFRGAIYSSCPDPFNSDMMWLGSEGTGIIKFNKKSGEADYLPYQMLPEEGAPDPRIITGLRVFKIVAGPDNKLYIGTEFGINIYDTKSGLFEFIQHSAGDPNSLTEGKIITIYFDKQNRLWAGSMSGGLSKFDKKTGHFTTFKAQGKAGALPNNRINDIMEDSRGQYWVATSMGLCRMNPSDGTFETFGEPDGLANDMVYGILEDARGNLWVSTNQGLSEFNTHTQTFHNFDSRDGLPGNEFNSNSFFKAADHRLYFGGVNGLVVFNPEKIRLNPNPPNPVFTSLKIYTRDSVIDMDVSYRNQIRISPGVNLISIEFASLSFINPENCRYAYKFNDENQSWMYIAHNRSVNISSPEPGTHKIFVKASNSDGVWNDTPTSIALMVQPRFYETAWFKLLGVLLFVLIVFAVYFVRINIIKKQKEKLKLLVEKKTRELSIINSQLSAANATKDRFFSIIAHDLKNPFNSLMGFSEMLQQDWNELGDKEKQEIVRMMNNTSTDTYALLVNLLEWSRIQNDKIEFRPSLMDFKYLVYEIYEHIKPNAYLKNLLIRIDIPDQLKIYADENMVLTLLRNLLSNAIKFTPRHGKINVFASADENMMQCCIEDSGIGMSEQQAEKLFTDDILTSSSGTEGETGTGLGMILCREFVKRHNGNIRVETKKGQGSRFCFTLPLASKEQLIEAEALAGSVSGFKAD